MKIVKSKLGNLAFKALRQDEATGYELVKYDKEPYDIEGWTRNQNSHFGVNYLIKADGTVIEVLPKEYKAHFPGTKDVDNNILIVVIGNEEAVGKSLSALISQLGFEATDDREPAKAPSVRSTDKVTGKKK